MLLQTNVAAQIETLVTLAGSTDLEACRSLSSLMDLKRSYRRFLASLGQRIIDTRCDEPTYVTTMADAARLKALFSNDSILDDKQQSNVITVEHDTEWQDKRARVENALHEIGLYAPAYAEIFRTVVTNIVILPSEIARAGSTSRAIGVIWANPKLSYTTSDLMEILLHEFTHQAMFLDELRYGHYSYRDIVDRSTWAKSAILNVRRPLDKVLHSVVVAAEILLFRQLYIGQPVTPRVHPPTSIMLRQLEDSVSSLDAAIRRHPNVLTPRADGIIANVRHLMSQALRPSTTVSSLCNI